MSLVGSTLKAIREWRRRNLYQSRRNKPTNKWPRDRCYRRTNASQTTIFCSSWMVVKRSSSQSFVSPRWRNNKLPGRRLSILECIHVVFKFVEDRPKSQIFFDFSFCCCCSLTPHSSIFHHYCCCPISLTSSLASSMDTRRSSSDEVGSVLFLFFVISHSLVSDYLCLCDVPRTRFN